MCFGFNRKVVVAGSPKLFMAVCVVSGQVTLMTFTNINNHTHTENQQKMTDLIFLNNGWRVFLYCFSC